MTTTEQRLAEIRELLVNITQGEWRAVWETGDGRTLNPADGRSWNIYTEQSMPDSFNDLGAMMYQKDAEFIAAAPTIISELLSLVDQYRKDAIPPEILDLVRFMCATWSAIDKWAYAHCNCSDALIKYPVVQGTRNQLNLSRIGEQPFRTTNIRKAVEWMLAHGETIDRAMSDGNP